MITGLFDHYWLTLQQNQLVLSVLLGLAARKEYSNNLYENKILVYCDGGSRETGKSASAFVVEESGKIIYSSAKYLGIATNNYAEYGAVLSAINWLRENKTSQTKRNYFYS